MQLLHFRKQFQPIEARALHPDVEKDETRHTVVDGS